jgi:hypothetical protein
MLASNDNVYSCERELAIWKMVRAGLPLEVIRSLMGLSESEAATYSRRFTPAPRSVASPQ